MDAIQRNLVGHKMSELRYIDPLPEATEEEGRKDFSSPSQSNRSTTQNKFLSAI
jgi:hypothetical protein